MHRHISISLLIVGSFITLLSYLYIDSLVLERSTFAFWITSTRIASLALMLFLTATILSLGKKFISERFYWFGLFLIPALISLLFHILSIVFLPDFITKNTVDKADYLFALSKLYHLIAFTVLVFYHKLKGWISLKVYIPVLASSLFLSFFIVLFYPTLLPFYAEGIGQTLYKDLLDVFMAFLYAFFALYILRNKTFEEGFWHMFTAFGFLFLHSIALSLYKHLYDFLIVLASFYWLIAGITIICVILYLNLRGKAVKIIDETFYLLKEIIKLKPTEKDHVSFLKLDHPYEFIDVFLLYDLDKKALIAMASHEKHSQIPEINLSSLKNIIDGNKDYYMDEKACYIFHGNYLFIAYLKNTSENPLIQLHILNTGSLILSHLLNWINFNRIVEKKAKELQRLHILLETSEYTTQAYNNIETVSKQVIERLDYVLKMDGSLFYIWNVNTELPDKLVFSNGFLNNFSYLKVYELMNYVMEKTEPYGLEENYIYCRFDEKSYKSGVIGFRKDRGFDEEELLFLKTVGNHLLHAIRLMKIIEDLERAQVQISFLLEYDPLTTMHNRKSFERLLEEEMDMSDRFKDHLCVLFVDIDNFKAINDTYGHYMGDMALKHVAEVIKKGTRKVDIAARLGGDEFAILLPKTDKEGAEYLAKRLKEKVATQHLIIDNTEISMSISIGIVCYPLDAKSKEEMVFLGEALLHHIKKEGKGKIKVVDESMKNVYVSFIEIEKELLKGAGQKAIEVFLQEIVNLNTAKIEGFEALMRLRIGERLAPAAKFIYIAERVGVIQELDLVMIEQLFQKTYALKGNVLFFIYINLSPKDLSKGFIEKVVELAEKYHIEPKRVVFEITEREAIEDITTTADFIKEIKGMGFKFAIDDFGSGYSSFLYLKYLPVDFLKIEGEFIKNMKNSPIDKSFVKSMVDIAKVLGIKTIAEHVEDEETISILFSLGVDYAQGYHIGKPGPMEEKLKNLFSTEGVQDLGKTD